MKEGQALLNRILVGVSLGSLPLALLMGFAFQSFSDRLGQGSALLGKVEDGQYYIEMPNGTLKAVPFSDWALDWTLSLLLIISALLVMASLLYLTWRFGFGSMGQTAKKALGRRQWKP